MQCFSMGHMEGRAGLRMGNIKTLRRQAQTTGGVWPTERVDKLLPGDDGRATGVALGRCSDNILRSFNATSVAKEVVDDLFPVAQGIHESAPASFCLRYAIEFSRLRVLAAIRSVAPSDAVHIMDEIRAQKSVVDRRVLFYVAFVYVLIRGPCDGWAHNCFACLCRL